MTLYDVKDQSLVPATALLCEVELNDGSKRYWASASCQDGAQAYQARLHPDQASAWKLSNDVTSESAGFVPAVLADADGAIAQLFKAGKLRGARVKFHAAVLNGRNVEGKTVLLSGLLDSVSEIDGRSAKLNVLSRLSSIRSSFPPMRIQKQCSWIFPTDAAERTAALSLGEDGRYSSLFRCGYSPDVDGGVGNLNGTEPFTSCDYSRNSCEQRGMFAKDAANQTTQRFSGIEFVPPSILVRGHGESSQRVSNLVSIDTRFNDVVPAVYGMGWLQAPVVFSRNDGNLTRCEVLLGLGEIESVIKVVANGYEIPEAVQGKNMTGSGWYTVISKGNRTGALNLGFTDGAGKPVGDPYASMAYINLVVPNQISDGKSSPKVQVLMKGIRPPVLDAEGALVSNEWTSNPAWILCDILRRTGWKLDELDLGSFIAAAAFCDEEIDAKDANGVTRQIKRFECNLVLKRRYSVAELLRSIRLGSLLYLFFQPDGRLAVRPETAIANQQPVKPAGSNSVETVNSGWPSYEFGDGQDQTSGILLKSNREADFRVFSKLSQDSPNRVSFEIQDALNEFQQDSVSIADTEDIQQRRQEITQSLPVTGVPNFPQAQRICQTWLNKSLAGNVFVEFKTSVRGFHLRPGDLITLTYERYGFERTLFRISEFYFSPQLDVMRVVAQLHQDHWYSDNAQIRYDTSRRYSWGTGAVRAVSGTLVEDGKLVFDASESLAVDADGTQKCALKIPFRKPKPALGTVSSIPLVSFDYEVESTGGTVPQGTYYYGLTSVDENGNESALSSLVPVRVGGLTATNKVKLKGISASESTASLHLYRGSSPYDLVRVGSALAAGATIVDAGGGATAEVPPDADYSFLRAYFRQTHLVDQSATSWSETTIARTNLNLVVDRWIGRKVVIRSGKGEGQERNIVANTEEELAIDAPWETLPDATSKFAIVEGNWMRGEESETDVITVLLPLLTTATFDVNLRSVGKDGGELDAAESPSVIWQIGVGSTSSGDTDVPPEPGFGFSLIEEGTVSIGGIGFSTVSNLGSVYVGQLGILFWDELLSPTSLSLGADLAEGDSEIQLGGLTAELAEGTVVQIEKELMQVTGAPAGDIYPVTRARYGTFTAAHAGGVPVFQLERREMSIPFVPGYFRGTSAVGFRYNFRLPNVRISAADMTLYNRAGASPVGEASYTVLVSDGARTLSGGQITLNVHGYLSIEASAGTSFVLDRTTVVRDVAAYVQEAPVGAPIEIIVRVDGVNYCELVIAEGATTATAVNKFNTAPLPAQAVLSFDVTNVPPAELGSPGKDLTVVFQT